MNKLLLGDCIKRMQNLKTGSITAIVTDPPYELGFMGKKWDASGIAYSVEMWSEALRVLKPGGYLLAFSGTRTYHRMAVAIEDAGFEIRNMIGWCYASGFPKSLNIGKAVDKKMGNEREKVADGKSGKTAIWQEKGNMGEFDITKGNSEWEGWGTALKPAHEPICMARKPLSEKTVAENVLKYGTGGINIDGTRIPYVSEGDKQKAHYNAKGMERLKKEEGEKLGSFNGGWKKHKPEMPQGRFPANLCSTGNALDDGRVLTSGKGEIGSGGNRKEHYFGANTIQSCYADSGSFNRYFDIDTWFNENLKKLPERVQKVYPMLICPKASKSERNKGCEELEDITVKSWHFKCKKCGKTYSEQSYKSGCHCENPDVEEWTGVSKNNHPTVKPLTLMSWLITLVSKEGDTILDPFAGSGSTLVSAKMLNRSYIGIDMTPEYIEICKARLNAVPDKLL